MPRLKMALAPPTLFSALLLSACGEPVRVAAAVKPPVERLACVKAAERPTIPAEYVIPWATVTTPAQARDEYAKYVASVRSREGVIVGYVVRLEGALFACSDNAAWLRDFYKGLPDKP